MSAKESKDHQRATSRAAITTMKAPNNKKITSPDIITSTSKEHTLTTTFTEALYKQQKRQQKQLNLLQVQP